MKILTAVIAVYWSLAFVGYVVGTYQPSKLIVGALLLYVAVDFVCTALKAQDLE
ncbi:hypothetical protein MHB77_32400 [Paenibacillus sp. FSL K6-3166]|uniref:hypothetical protein n=1 Tax=unclassified Paenibacillus TaxID=185978 RepID=UPI0015C665B0|nr:hypothetical protein [Paenibacillus sp. VTT E-133291]